MAPSRDHHAFDTDHSATGGMVGHALTKARQFLCGIHGHDALLHFTHGRLSLLCSSCGYETPGWDVAPARSDRERPQPSRRRLVPTLAAARKA